MRVVVEDVLTAARQGVVVSLCLTTAEGKRLFIVRNNGEKIRTNRFRLHPATR